MIKKACGQGQGWCQSARVRLTPGVYWASGLVFMLLQERAMLGFGFGKGLGLGFGKGLGLGLGFGKGLRLGFDKGSGSDAIIFNDWSVPRHVYTYMALHQLGHTHVHMYMSTTLTLIPRQVMSDGSCGSKDTCSEVTLDVRLSSGCPTR